MYPLNNSLQMCRKSQYLRDDIAQPVYQRFLFKRYIVTRPGKEISRWKYLSLCSNATDDWQSCKWMVIMNTINIIHRDLHVPNYKYHNYRGNGRYKYSLKVLCTIVFSAPIYSSRLSSMFITSRSNDLIASFKGNNTTHYFVMRQRIFCVFKSTRQIRIDFLMLFVI